MSGRLSPRTPDQSGAFTIVPGEAQLEPTRDASAVTRAAWTLFGTIAATKLAMLSAIVLASRADDAGALISGAPLAWLAVAIALGGLALSRSRSRPAPSAAGRAWETWEVQPSGREPPVPVGHRSIRTI
jgi:hypothetical protein